MILTIRDHCEIVLFEMKTQREVLNQLIDALELCQCYGLLSGSTELAQSPKTDSPSEAK